MISSDDHPPPDPSSSDYQNHHHQQTSHDLKVNSDEKANASVSDIDLLKSLAADLDDADNPLPSFSIRDYVFNSRSKDIAWNWPFSRKTLQICLQHGVKNLLPPFESLDLLRNNSSVSRCTVENRPSSYGKPINDQFVSAGSYGGKSNQELALESINTNSSGSKGDKESRSHLQEDLAHTKSKKTPLVSSRKTENTTIQTAVKKCRVVAKLNSGVEPVEEVTPNNFIVLETMASKVCPVCKTFSSSSNTTLNAHIDQCLSGESSMKWTANPKVMVKHRIKPRKTRLMVDIYETAPHCTVEELDARNGTSWANNSCFPAQELEFQGEEEKEEHRATTIIPEVADHEGAVYIDTDGTKVRILSVPKVATSDDRGAQKLLKGGKLSKFFMGKKKKNKTHENKHQQKYLKLSPKSKKFCSPKPHHGASSEVTTGREENVAIEESCIKDDQGKQPMKPEGHMRMDDLPITRPPWACSKRTRLAKKFGGNLHLRHNATNNLSVASDKSSPECGLRTAPSSSDDMSAQQSSQKMGTLLQYKEQPPTSNRVMEFRSGSPVGHYAKKRSRLLTKPSSKNLRKEVSLLHDSCEDPSNACPSKPSEGSDVRSKGSKFSASRKNILAVSREPASKFNLKRKFAALKRSCVHSLSNENAVMGPSQDSSNQQSRVEEYTSGKMPFESMNLLEVRKKEETNICRQENSVASKSSDGDSSARLETDLADPLCDVESVRKETRYHWEQDGTMQAPRGIDVEGSSIALSNSLNPVFPKLVSQPDNMFDSRECIELYQSDQLCSPKRTQDDKVMYCADFIEKSLHIDDVTDDIERQQNYFQEIDPIPIPGPPGSFLPSPGGDMVSEELQGNSSLTTMSRVQSSEDQHHHDMMDRDSMSDSPISTISNPSFARSDSRSSDKFSARSTSLKDDTRGFSGVMVDALNEKYATITSSVNAGDWRLVHTIFTEKGPSSIGFKNDQPCRCSRKEGASSQTVASSYHESTLLKKRAVESLNFRPEMFSISNYPTSQAPPPVPETVISPPAMKLPAESSVKLPVYSECDSAGSPSKPVLRLMGKNLTVAKTDEDVSSSQQFRPPPRLSPTGQFPNNVQNEYDSSSLGYHPQHPIIFSQNQNGSKSQHPNVQPPNNLRSQVDLRPIHALDTISRSTTSVDCYGHGSPQLAPMMPQARASQGRNRLDGQVASGRNMHKAPSKPIKEIIIIDDSPEGEENDSMHMRRNWASLSSSTPVHNHMHSGYLPQRSARANSGGSSLAFRNGSFQTCSPFREVANNGNLAQWNHTPAGSSSMLQASSLGSPSPSTSHFRSSTIYYPPSFS